ncbi:MAG: 2-succinyl-5-enolpyruvyl-6-hydroxy-3-cyclohexene-1-carboxylic-acid synthase [Parachlamydiales bacterium]|jgi:2-succinyl-5-enolpyruvyl-6-hydroxy-3-cyclohexene-1-carboxylate synthase
MSRELVHQILDGLEKLGVVHITLCPSSRNAYFVQELKSSERFKVTSWFEERSAAFYTLGLIKNSGKPAVIITTSGTAAAETLPATMEAFYSGLPLIILTTDRPRRYRLTGAPQSAEQVGLFSHYVHAEEDIADGETLKFTSNLCPKGPLHLNVCLEDPYGKGKIDPHTKPEWSLQDFEYDKETLSNFLDNAVCPFVIVSGLTKEEQPAVESFLRILKAPVYLEASSGLRENKALDHLSIRTTEGIWQRAEKAGYPIDAVLRIGGVPTLRMWRDLDECQGKYALLSISANPFPGASWSKCLVGNLIGLKDTVVHKEYEPYNNFIKEDQKVLEKRLISFDKFPSSEPALVHYLSQLIGTESFVYLGNSLPIREWDMAASFSHPHANIAANRGVNGIDGQLSTFFGMCREDVPCWGIFGDLTTLYDMSAPWALFQNPHIKPVCVVINNGGGKIFERMYGDKAFYNCHNLSFAPLASLWNMQYVQWHTVPEKLPPNIYQKAYLIEIIPDAEQTKLFWSADNS